MSKIVFLDVDGTLIDYETKLPDSLPELRVLVICYWMPITLLVMSFTMKQPKKLLMS